MLDPKLIRNNPDIVKSNLQKRKDPEAIKRVDLFLELDKAWRELSKEVEELRKERNISAKQISTMKGEEQKNKIQEVAKLKLKLTDLETQLTDIINKRQHTLDLIPNLLHDSVPYGEDDGDNVQMRTWGKVPKFSFPVKDQHDLLHDLDLVELDRARKVSGARFYYLKNEATLLELALLNYTLSIITKEGFKMFTTPSMVRREVLYGTGFFPGSEEDIYKIENEDLYLTGTSEVTLGGLHMNETLLEPELPLWYTGLSSCYRTEASSTTRDDKGIFRVHEFKKVEMFKFVEPSTSWDEQEHLISVAEKIFQGLELPYRVVNICTGDIGTVAARKYDIEAWFPGQNRYREVVSCSNCTDYQARRMNIKYREQEGVPPKGFVHTLNSTAIATTRAMIALIENNQQKDGSVKIPKVLHPYLPFTEITNK